MTFTYKDLKRENGKPEIIATVIPELESNDQLRRIESERKLIKFIPEIRWDLSGSKGRTELKNYLRKIEGLSMNAIFTFRSSDKYISNLYYDIALEFPNIMIDLDLSQYDEGKIRGNEERVIISSHFSNEIEIFGLFNEIKNIGCRSIKLATHFTDGFFFEVVRAFSELGGNMSISIVPQGPDGSKKRIISALTVSDFVYSYFDKSVAEGQISYKEINNVLQMLRY